MNYNDEIEKLSKVELKRFLLAYPEILNEEGKEKLERCFLIHMIASFEMYITLTCSARHPTRIKRMQAQVRKYKKLLIELESRRIK